MRDGVAQRRNGNPMLRIVRQILFVWLGIVVAAGAATGQTNYPYGINTVAGSNPIGNGGLAVYALLEFPGPVTVDAIGNLYIADGGGNGIRKVAADGTINVVATNVTAYAMAADK